MKLAGYIRVSTEGQVDAFGKDVQREGITRWAGLNDHVVTAWFEEDAVSGKTDGGERPMLVSVLARADEFDGIVFFDASRIARRSVVQETLLGLIWSSGLRVFTSTAGEMDADEDDPTKIMIRQILAVIAEFDHRSIVRKLQAARKIKASRGGYIGGITAYGLSVVGTGKNAQLVRNEVESVVVERIMELYAEGEGTSQRSIAARLNAEGHKTKLGADWTAVQVGRVLRRYNA